MFCFMSSVTTSAVSAGAVSTTLALAVGLGSSRKLHDNSGDKAARNETFH